MRAILSLIAIVAVSGCQQTGVTGPVGPGTTEPPTMIATEGVIDAAGTVTFRLTNRTSTAVGYNLCRARLERSDGEGDWRPVLQSLGEVCTAELRTLRPGQGASYSFKIQPKFRPGRYRIATELEDMQGRSRFTAVSNTFMITHDN